ncbi:hypothetical protein CHU32_16160 [Superficieibacter electus]|uniref:Uncharacterized protein n=1 Tax=Superficieibacter electus TaxID=2022662 RepID=A0A2P5GN35_9ENTR|nr:hypothetical protein CHU33_11605 [Superficieibacter electus]POP47527.1 hypothetical protein CHU32_16160 [Superficieibacter electus]
MPGGGCALRGLHDGYASGVRGLNAGRRLRLARPTWLIAPLACVGVSICSPGKRSATGEAFNLRGYR